MLDTVGPNDFVLYSEMSITEGLCLFLSQTIIVILYALFHAMVSFAKLEVLSS